MTEAEWLAAAEPRGMLRFVAQQPGARPGQLVRRRKERLFACACCRRIWDRLGERDRQLVNLSERYADGQLTRGRFLDGVVGLFGLSERPMAADLKQGLLNHLHRKHVMDRVPTAHHAADLIPAIAASEVLFALFYDWNKEGPSPADEQAVAKEKRAQADLLRCIIGNPFRPVAFSPSWRRRDVTALAAAIYEERAFDRLPILADAVEEAGCSDEQVLGHLRSGGEHARGCFALDVILGRE